MNNCNAIFDAKIRGRGEKLRLLALESVLGDVFKSPPEHFGLDSEFNAWLNADEGFEIPFGVRLKDPYQKLLNTEGEDAIRSVIFELAKKQSTIIRRAIELYASYASEDASTHQKQVEVVSPLAKIIPGELLEIEPENQEQDHRNPKVGDTYLWKDKEITISELNPEANKDSNNYIKFSNGMQTSLIALGHMLYAQHKVSIAIYESSDSVDQVECQSPTPKFKG